MNKKVEILQWPVRKIIVFPLKCLLAFVGLVIFSILKVLGYRVCLLVGERIGHLAANTEIILRKNTLISKDRRTKIIFVSDKPSNAQLMKMIKRRIVVFDGVVYVSTYRLMKKVFPSSKVWMPSPSIPENIDIFNSVKAQLKFTEGEEKQGMDLLEEIGIERDASFVCVYARDSQYLSQIHEKREWDYHNYRDCNIENYTKAAEYLTSLDIYVVRMGYCVRDAWKTNNPMIIDYATKFRNDFGDIYLSAKCKFFLVSDGGLSSLPWIFDVPVAYSNVPVVGGTAAWRQGDVYIYKKLWCRTKKRYLTFNEIYKYGADRWWKQELYDIANLEVHENTQEEIFLLTKELNERLDGSWVESSDEIKLREKFCSLIPSNHIVRTYKSRISIDFLRANENFLQ